MKIFIDSQFRCNLSPGEGLREIETGFFDDKCTAFVQGYRYIPAGDSWIRSDGVVFTGEMIAPAENIKWLEAAQAAYEEAQAKNADALAALEVLGVQP